MSKKQLFLILQTVLLLAATEALVLSAAARLRSADILVGSGTTLELSAPRLIFSFLLSTAVLFFLIRKLRRRVVFEAIFGLSILIGLWALLELYLPQEALFLALGLIALRYLFPLIIAQNVIMLGGIAGIAASLGSVIAWESMAVVLIILGLYDVIAVYGTHHMVTMFKGLLDKGVIFALILPERPRWFFKKLRAVTPGEGFFFLGTGDLALPAVFVAAAAREGFWFGVGAAAGSLLGLLGTDLLFQLGHRRPLPALPSIVLGTLAGFGVIRLLS
ncbi:hypothetical protein HYW17_03405 [Candidatus Uhrbacteria bacterium]|nr:hypothetical protein [Candidatus Uhrbacteria bacterium]